ncbi:hypothetical protein BT69DRAFT_1188605, partial [Atractiella rhizophila]
CNMAKAELFAEFKECEDSEPFYSDGSEAEDDDGTRTRGQITIYHTTIEARQHRTSVFSFYIRHNLARLFSHSRGGTLFSKLFDYTKDHHLQEFLWRYTHSTDEYRGHDVSVQPAIKVVPESDWQVARSCLGMADDEEVSAVMIGSEGPFLFASSITQMHLRPTGRGTCCYRAYNSKYGVVLLKDTWRKSEYPREGETYSLLQNPPIPHIPVALAEGDVGGHGQEVELIREDAPDARPTTLVHYRIILHKIGKPIDSFKTSWQFVKCVSDALEAHTAAVRRGILHRDISVGNILIFQKDEASEPEGLLIDWDVAQRMGKEWEPPGIERMGPFQFMAWELADNNTVEHLPEHDLQSFFYLLLWLALRYCPGAATMEERQEALNKFE